MGLLIDETNKKYIQIKNTALRTEVLTLN